MKRMAVHLAWFVEQSGIACPLPACGNDGDFLQITTDHSKVTCKRCAAWMLKRDV